jgi:hypothetical protein
MKLALLVAIAATTPAMGATLYWNADGAGGGVGTWDSSTTAVWNPASDFSGTNGVWTQPGGEDIAEFRGPGSATVTVSGTVNVNRIRFASTTGNNWTLTGGTINLTGEAVLERQVNNQFYSSNISGNNGVTFLGGGIQVFQTTQKTYLGPTNINGNTLRLATANVLPFTTVVTFNGGNVDQRANAQIAGLAGTTTGGWTNTTNSATLTLDRDSGSSTFGGTLAQSGTTLSITKAGGYTQILTGSLANTATGTHTINGGVLALAKTAGTDAIANAPIVLNGGQLRLDNSNQINDAADMSFSGGTFNLNGFDETLDIATLTANSSIDFGTDGSILSLSQLLRTGGVLTINNWDGSPNVGGGLDQLRVTSLPDADVLSNIVFSNYQANAIAINFGSYFEIVPEVVSVIPEPASLCLLAGAALLPLRRRRV